MPRVPTSSPFRYFKTSPEVIRPAVMLYGRFPLSLRVVYDRLHKRGMGESWTARSDTGAMAASASA